MGSARSLLVAAVVSVAVGGCTEIHDTRGYIVDRALVASVQSGIDNKASVQGTLGRPTFASEFDTSTWYYVNRQTQQLAFGT
ncbi:outer membrane protein assembly factor BamE, partial [Klebsiella pneumoniae]